MREMNEIGENVLKGFLIPLGEVQTGFRGKTRAWGSETVGSIGNY